MKKRKINSSPSPLDALQYLESMRQLSEDKDEPTVMISLRVPGNLLKTIKNKAKVENKKYQSLIIEILRAGLKSKS